MLGGIEGDAISKLIAINIGRRGIAQLLPLAKEIRNDRSQLYPAKEMQKDRDGIIPTSVEVKKYTAALFLQQKI